MRDKRNLHRVAKFAMAHLWPQDGARAQVSAKALLGERVDIDAVVVCACIDGARFLANVPCRVGRTEARPGVGLRLLSWERSSGSLPGVNQAGVPFRAFLRLDGHKQCKQWSKACC